MSSNKKIDIEEFPDVEAKLQKPTKQSAFERQKAEAEAKRKREEAETAAVYQDFVKSFDDGASDDEHGGVFASSRGSSRASRDNGAALPPRPGFGGQPAFGGAAGKRHFSSKTGPGSLGPPPMSFGKKRAYDGFQPTNRRDRDDNGGRLGFHDYDPGHKPVSKAFDNSDDEADQTPLARAEEKAVAKPTLRLANLPPTTSPAAIKALIPSNLTIENVKILPPAAPNGQERKSIAAIVTLSQETAASEIDGAVSALQNRYLGFGFYLSLHRHLSSAAISTAVLPSLSSSSNTQHPFGAKPVAQQGHHGPGSHGRFAPPSSYGPAGLGPISLNTLHVPIQPPKDIKQLRTIHKVIEAVLEHGPEFEALLMSRPDVQKDETWAWIWDARSPGGIWYRWRLWEIITGSQRKRGQGKYLPLFEGSSAWKIPDQPLAYEYTTGVDGFVSESEYNSSDEDEFEDEPNKLAEGGKDPEEVFLNPIEKAKLTHLLSRLPTTLARIRKGDIARITTFAITHSSRGADEVVDMIVSNAQWPFAYTSANPDCRKESGDENRHDEDSRDDIPAPAEDKPNTGNLSASKDTSAAKLVALYVISDILSSSSTSGIRHAWRYRQLFEVALKKHNVFEGLGLMAERMNWGRLRAEKWKRSVGLILGLWEGWCVFPNETQESFVRSFEKPPALSRRKEKPEDDGESKKGGGSRWKTVDAAAPPKATAPGAGFRPLASLGTTPDAAPEQSDQAESDGSYEEYTDDEDADNELLASYPIDGEPLVEVDIVGLPIDGTDGDTPMAEAAVSVESGSGRRSGGSMATKILTEDAGQPGKESNVGSTKMVGGFQMLASSHTAPPSRKRLRAADMFADSDESGGE